jgi:putative transposase
VTSAPTTKVARTGSTLEDVRRAARRARTDHARCGRICFAGRKVSLSQGVAGQKGGVTQVDERVWLVTFMQYDLGYFDDEPARVQPIDYPFGSKVLPMSSE